MNASLLFVVAALVCAAAGEPILYGAFSDGTVGTISMETGEVTDRVTIPRQPKLISTNRFGTYVADTEDDVYYITRGSPIARMLVSFDNGHITDIAAGDKYLAVVLDNKHLVFVDIVSKKQWDYGALPRQPALSGAISGEDWFWYVDGKSPSVWLESMGGSGEVRLYGRCPLPTAYDKWATTSALVCDGFVMASWGDHISYDPQNIMWPTKKPVIAMAVKGEIIEELLRPVEDNRVMVVAMADGVYRGCRATNGTDLVKFSSATPIDIAFTPKEM